MDVSTIMNYNQVAQMNQMMNRLITQARIFKSQVSSTLLLNNDSSFTGIGGNIDIFA